MLKIGIYIAIFALVAELLFLGYLCNESMSDCNVFESMFDTVKTAANTLGASAC